VDVELLVIPGGPGSEGAGELLRAALDGIGLADVTVTIRVIDSEDAARAWAFGGSPAFVGDGTDLFETTGDVGGDGLASLPGT